MWLHMVDGIEYKLNECWTTFHNGYRRVSGKFKEDFKIIHDCQVEF